MVSFENYPKIGDSNNFRTLLYVILGVVGAVLLYNLYQRWAYPLVDVPHSHKHTNAYLDPKHAGQKVDADLGDGYGYDASKDWNYLHSAHVGVEGVEGKDPSNDVQQYTKVTSDIDGKDYWEPVVKNMTQDYLTEDEFDFIVDRHTVGYSKCRLDYLTQPSYIRNADVFWGMHWPNENGEPLTNLRGACVEEKDIIHHGLFNSDSSKWGQSSYCSSEGGACIY
jgi:hypothetical protein